MKIMKYMMQVLLVGGLLTSCIEDADVTAYLTEDQLGNVAQEDPDKAFSAAEHCCIRYCVYIGYYKPYRLLCAVNGHHNIS